MISISPHCGDPHTFPRSPPFLEARSHSPFYKSPAATMSEHPRKRSRSRPKPVILDIDEDPVISYPSASKKRKMGTPLSPARITIRVAATPAVPIASVDPIEPVVPEDCTQFRPAVKTFLNKRTPFQPAIFSIRAVIYYLIAEGRQSLWPSEAAVFRERFTQQQRELLAQPGMTSSSLCANMTQSYMLVMSQLDILSP